MTPEERADRDRMISENRDALDRIRDGGLFEELCRSINHNHPDALRDALREAHLI